MRGPGGRSRHRIVRNWRCPRCGKTATTPGNVTVFACPSCPADEQGTPTWMTIEEPLRKPSRPWPGFEMPPLGIGDVPK